MRQGPRVRKFMRTKHLYVLAAALGVAGRLYKRFQLLIYGRVFDCFMLVFSDFFHNNIVYFTRNDNFTTLGSGISNAKIKLVNYKVMGGDKIMEALIKGEIDYGTPDATYDNQSLVTANRKSLGSADYANSGYGYVKPFLSIWFTTLS